MGEPVKYKSRRALEEIECSLPSCHVRFTPDRPWQKYHSRVCRKVAWEEANQRVSPQFYEPIIKMIDEAEADSPFLKAIQKAIYSKVQRQITHVKKKKRKP